MGTGYMTDHTLRRQFEISWGLLAYHLETLEDAECLWRPAPRSPHVAQLADGTWRADWPEDESYAAGAPSIAWLTWHIDFWWSMTFDHHLGDGTLTRERVAWGGSVEEMKRRIGAHRQRWIELLDAPDKWPGQARWPFADRPFEDVVAWLNVELMKNAAEIGYARFVYGTRQI